MKKNELTEKQKAILDYIVKFKKENGYAPSFRNIGDAFGITVKGVSDHLHAMKKKGWISIDEGIARSIVVLP